MPVMLAALLLFATPDDAEIARGLRNLAWMHSISTAEQIRLAVKTDRPRPERIDPWGTPYRIEGTRVVSAGSDRTFEEGPLPNEQFTGTEGDAVIAGGAMVRSNRIWLAERAGGEESAAALEYLQRQEVLQMTWRNPEARYLMLARTTVEMLRAGETKDAWGNPFRVEGTRIISAGADGVFDPMSWSRPPKLDAAEDIVFENGEVVRMFDEKQYREERPVAAVAVPQPPHASIVAGENLFAVGGDVKAPRPVHRVEPRYDDFYRWARISGSVILQAVISKTGAVEEVRLRKSCAPELDAAAMEALRQWKFAPATRNGEPVDVIFHLTINFKLK